MSSANAKTALHTFEWDGVKAGAVNPEQTLAFLKLFVWPGEEVWIQTFQDGPTSLYFEDTFTRKDGSSGSKLKYKLSKDGKTIRSDVTACGSVKLEEFQPGTEFIKTSTYDSLAQVGLFLAVNALDPDAKKRSSDTVRRVRALFADFDGKPLPSSFCLPPTAIVESSPGRFHVYWAVSDVPLEDFTPIQKYLAQHFGSDPVVCDLARVMRLPGFWHGKKEPGFLSRVLEQNPDAQYTRADFLGAFEGLEAALEQAQQQTKARLEGAEISRKRALELKEELKSMDLSDRAAVLAKYAQAGMWDEVSKLSSTGQGGRNAQLFKSAAALGTLVGAGILERSEATLELEAAAFAVGLDEREVRSTLENGLRAGEQTPRDLSNVAQLAGQKKGKEAKVGKPSSKSSPRPGVESGEGESSSGFKMPGFTVGVQEGTDTANAYILARNGLNNRLRYSPGLGWLVYNPTTGTWKPDADLARAVQIAGKPLRIVVGRHYAQLLEARATREELSQANRWANSVCNVKTISSALSAASGMDEFYTSVNDWDAQPDLLNCLNGVLELRTQTLRPHCADDMFTRQAGAAYFADAQHPHVDKLLELLKADGRHDYLQRGTGSTLWGEAPNEVFQVLYGEGGTGKGTLVDGVTGMLGDYAHTADVNMLLAQRGGEQSSGPSPEMLELRGKRLVVCGEPPKGARFNAGKVKGLTGNDPVTARGMYSGVMVTFKPVFKLWVHTNYPVGAAHDDTGLQRRMRVTPFLTKPDKADPKFKKTLENDPHARSALLKWAVEGFKLWFESDFDLGVSDAVKNATTHYWSDQNPYEKFIAENLSFSPGAFIPSSKLKIVFETWLEDSDAKGKISDLHAELTKRKCSKDKEGRAASQVRGWRGVGLLETLETLETPRPPETPHVHTDLESSGGQAVSSVSSVSISKTDAPEREEKAFDA